MKELWAFGGNRIAVRFAYEWCDDAGYWFRSHGNENWLVDEHGYMAERHASINNVPIAEAERLFRWPRGPQPADHPGLSDVGLERTPSARGEHRTGGLDHPRQAQTGAGE